MDICFSQPQHKISVTNLSGVHLRRGQMSNMAQLSDVTRFLELTNDAKCLADLDRLLEDIALDMGFDF